MSSITNVPLDLIRPSLEIPDSPVVLSKGREDNKSFTGSAFHPNVLGWTQSVVRPMESDDSHGQDPSRGARSYGVTLPSSEVCIPENPSFQHKDKVGWCCDLVTTDIHCTVSDAKGRDGIPSSEAPHTQKCQVQWTLVLDPGIAGCLEDETLTQSHPESPKANVRSCNRFEGSVLIPRTKDLSPRGGASLPVYHFYVARRGVSRQTVEYVQASADRYSYADHTSDSTILGTATLQRHPRQMPLGQRHRLFTMAKHCI